MDEHEATGSENPLENAVVEPTSELWESPLGQGTYMFFWGLASFASFAIFFKFF